MSLLVESIQPLPEWQQAVVILVVAVLAALLIGKAIEGWIARSKRFDQTELDRVVLDEIDTPLILTIVLTGVYATVPFVGLPRLEFFLTASILTVILVLWTRTGIRLAAQLLRHFREEGREIEFGPVLKNLWTFFLLFGAFFTLLAIWRIDITPLLASAGVAGIIIGIAAQDSIGNFFAGISLHLDQTYRVGDVLQLADGTRGTVTNMTIRSTTILTRDNIEVTIPNSELNSTQVINESAPQRRRRIRLDVGVAYGSDLSHVEDTLLATAEAEPIVMDAPPPRVRFRSFEDSAIRAQLQCYIQHPAQWGEARHCLIMGITSAFESEGIKIPFPQRELTFFEADNEIRIDGSLVEERPTEADPDMP